MKRICCVAHHNYDAHPHIQRDLKTLVENGYAVDIVCLKENGQKYRETIDGINVYRIPVEHHRRGLVRYLLEYVIAFTLFSVTLTYLHLRKRYAAIEVDNMPDFLVFTALIPKIFGAKVVLYIFDNVPEYFAYKHGLGEKHPITRGWQFIERISAAFSDQVIVTQSLARQAIERHGVPGSKINVVLNTPREGIFHKIDSSKRENENKSFVVMTHGEILHSYGNQTIIEAIPLVLDHIPELQVRIVGYGEYLDELKELVRKLGVSEYVDFTGKVPHEEMGRMISDADIGIVPKLIDLMLPNKLMEYVAVGKPVIAAAQPTIMAYFDERSMMFFEPGNAKDLARCLIELYRDPSRREAMASCGSETFEKYRWKVIKDDYLGLYRDLLC